MSPREDAGIHLSEKIRLTAFVSVCPGRIRVLGVAKTDRSMGSHNAEAARREKRRTDRVCRGGPHDRWAVRGAGGLVFICFHGLDRKFVSEVV